MDIVKAGAHDILIKPFSKMNYRQNFLECLERFIIFIHVNPQKRDTKIF
jgi:FixJ family two-component response regulator